MNGNLFIVSAPSGAGKSTLVNALLAEDSQLALSISHTTRAPRDGESEGAHYHFVDRKTFDAMMVRAEFLESAEVHGNLYGTSRKWLTDARTRGLDIVLEIDWQGARSVRHIFPDAITIFILPPSMTELERRLRTRGKDSEDSIRTRMTNALDEIRHAIEFDYVIINKDFESARQDLAAVVRASRLTLSRQAARQPEVFDSFR